MPLARTRYAALIKATEERSAQFRKDVIADISDRRRADSKNEAEKTEAGQPLDQFPDGGAADKKVLAAIVAPFGQDDRLDVGDLGMGLGNPMECRALLGAETDTPGLIGLAEPVSPSDRKTRTGRRKKGDRAAGAT